MFIGSENNNACRMAEQMTQYHFSARYKDQKQTLGTDISILFKLLEDGILKILFNTTIRIP